MPRLRLLLFVVLFLCQHSWRLERLVCNGLTDNKDDDHSARPCTSPKNCYIPGPYQPTHSPYSPDTPSYSPERYNNEDDDHIIYPPSIPQYYFPQNILLLHQLHPDHSTFHNHINPQNNLNVSENPLETQTDVALGITKQLLLTLGKDKNMVFSPLSIHIGLGMILAGTKGHVQDRFLSFLKCKSINELSDLASIVHPVLFADGYSKGGPRFTFVNGVCIEKSLHVKPSFKEVIDTTYKPAFNQVDFQTRADEVRCEVNSWVDKETNGLIKDFLAAGSVSSSTQLILANALYFKGAWSKKFNESMTEELDFHLQNGSKVKAPFMTGPMYQFVSVFDNFKVLKLPYEQGTAYDRRFSMCFYLPDATDGLQTLVERICSESIDRHIPNRRALLDKFLIPKFKISVDFDPMDVLKPLGFSLKDGDVTEIVEGKVSVCMYQKSFIEVDEEGTKAAAAGYIALSPAWSSSEPFKPPPLEFVADHPFLYLIREEVTGTVMFVGHVLNPIEEI